MNIFKTAIAALAAALISSLAQAGERVETINGREVLIVEPDRLKGEAPLVLAFHGGFGNMNHFSRSMSLSNAARLKGFRVAYMQGTGKGPRGNIGRSWNAGKCCGPAEQKRMDDLGYINAVIDHFADQGLVSQVSMVGHSNGAMMIYRYLCEGTKPVHSAVLISGSLMVNDCSLANGPAPRVLAIHGERDDHVPIDGGKGEGPSGASFSSQEWSLNRLRDAGAKVGTILLPQAGHSLREVNTEYSKQEGNRLPAGVATYLLAR